MEIKTKTLNRTQRKLDSFLLVAIPQITYFSIMKES
jgi:hypothetical protein